MQPALGIVEDVPDAAGEARRREHRQERGEGEEGEGGNGRQVRRPGEKDERAVAERVRCAGQAEELGRRGEDDGEERPRRARGR
jgi:hypothetical protein